MKLKRRTYFRALTLLEALMAAVVLSIAVAAFSQAIVAGQMQTYEALEQGRAMDLAQGLMEEVIRLPYDDPDGTSTFGPDAGETGRTLYDDVNDFNGFSESAGSLADAAGSSLDTSYQGFSREVTVTAGSVNIAALGGSISGVTIVVTVKLGANVSWSISQFVPDPPDS